MGRFSNQEKTEKLAEIAELKSKGHSTVEALQKAGISDATYYNWRSPKKKAKEMFTLAVPETVNTKIIALIGSRTEVLAVIRELNV